MSTLGMYELTHPELLSESELKEILENRCIDFDNYKSLSKSELIDLYKRVALPLPQRQSESIDNLDTKKYTEAMRFANESHRNSVSSDNPTNTATDLNETREASEFSCTRSKSPTNEDTEASKKMRLHNSNNVTKCNGIDKRINNEKIDEAPMKKRQKITWP
ncbi:uncharacterized protein LOC143426876 [Xylocopa sonorina]|uniref:uncharacterized protein LOC143426876 n=1 Tax=Xylocopa sonorina TaxID=1818115 RepID=UPI00403A963E